ncbi:MAG TPA: amino acid ABC transporter substrate-binding protein, partial [Rhodospirillales bacterium]|nr:amino acid ABC transporter substrate-binding protein [Rhodospirillales bacterium]
EEINAAGGILGRSIEITHFDTQSNPGVSRAAVQKALDLDPYVVLGPIYSSSTKVNMQLTRQAGVPQIVGSEASVITEMGNPFIFRTSLSQAASMPKLANYIRDGIGAKSVAVLWVNNDFGRGGRDAFVAEMEKRGIKVVADISSEVGQSDFAADVVKIKQAAPDAAFVYLHEEESARFLREARKQGLDVPLIGETTLLNQKVIELAGEAANGVRGHVGLSADAPLPSIAAFRDKFVARYDTTPDHNAIKGYLAVYTVKEITERIGGFDRKAFADALHCTTITLEQEPGILIETSWDDKGDVDRVSFLAEVVDGKQKIVDTLPPLGVTCN